MFKMRSVGWHEPTNLKAVRYLVRTQKQNPEADVKWTVYWQRSTRICDAATTSRLEEEIRNQRGKNPPKTEDHWTQVWPQRLCNLAELLWEAEVLIVRWWVMESRCCSEPGAEGGDKRDGCGGGSTHPHRRAKRERRGKKGGETEQGKGALRRSFQTRPIYHIKMSL